MNSKSFTYQGKEYKIAKIAELEPYAGNRRLQITTKDKTQFTLNFNQSIYKWVIDKSK